MFTSVVNPMCKRFVENGAMHESAQRLHEAALKIGRASKQGEVADFAGVTPQVLTNWETRGVSKAGRLSLLSKHGVNPVWIETGSGEMTAGPPPALIGKPATDAATTLVQALEVVAQALQGADELSRIQAKPLIQHLMEHPEQAANITHRLAALLNRSGLPPAQTSDFAAPAPTHHFQKTPNGA